MEIATSSMLASTNEYIVLVVLCGKSEKIHTEEIHNEIKKVFSKISISREVLNVTLSRMVNKELIHRYLESCHRSIRGGGRRNVYQIARKGEKIFLRTRAVLKELAEKS